MAYRLKSVRYEDTPRKILLQNENGPCPLLAAANALLLRGVIALPSSCIQNGVASIDDIVNILAERALKQAGSSANNYSNEWKSVTSQKKNDEIPNGDSDVVTAVDRSILDQEYHREHHINELLKLFPSLQYGMDVNPKFTAGPTGVEYTLNLTAFDLMGVELVHGWLLDPQDVETVGLVKNKSYNELVEMVVQGTEASSEVEKLSKLIKEKERELNELNGTKAEVDTIVEKENSNTLVLITASKSNDQEDWINVTSTDHNVVKNDTGCIVAEGAEVKIAGDYSGENDVKIIEVNSDGSFESKSITNHVIKGKDNELSNSDDYTNIDNGTDCGGGDCASATISTCGATTAISTCGDIVSDMMDPDNIDTPSEAVSIIEAENNGEDICVVNKDTKSDLIKLREICNKKSQIATNGSLINAFLTSTAHQLTYHGLLELNNYLTEQSLCVFFRNNHYSTLTKRQGILYMLVTDLGYANVSEVMWEKLDNINGDTEYADEFFVPTKPRNDIAAASGPFLSPEQMLAQSSRTEADYQLALQLSQNGNEALAQQKLDEDEGRLIAVAKEASLKEWNEQSSHVDEGKTKSMNATEYIRNLSDMKETSTSMSSISKYDSIIDSATQVDDDTDRILALEMHANYEKEQASEQLAQLLYAQDQHYANFASSNQQDGATSSSSTSSPKNKSACVVS